MNYNEILAAAKDCVGPYCKACPVSVATPCPAPAANIPAMWLPGTSTCGRRSA